MKPIVSLLLLTAATQASAQFFVSIPIQYRGRWAENCSSGFSLTVSEHAIGNLQIKGVIEDLPGHTIVLARGSEVKFFPQIGANGRLAMVSFKTPNQKKFRGKIMKLCND